jgi:hypothetical protein
VRLVDDTGHSQYVATCPETAPPVAGFTTLTGGPLPYPYVDIDSTNTPIVAPSAQSVSTASGYCAGRCWVNPVQTVRWEITGPPGATDAEPAQYANALDNTSLPPYPQDTAKYDLMRSYVDARGVLVPETSEIVAEYAVDLDLAFTVDQGLSNQQPSLLTYGFDNTTGNSQWAKDQSQGVTVNVGPQRIRAVRFRLATRTAQPDRTANVPVTNNPNEEFLYRYCVVSPCPSPPDRTARWARVRTITSEVRLQNLGRYYY